MATPTNQGWRVKLYQLNEDGQWDDRGTGSITVSHMDVFSGPGVLVASEEGGRDLLQSRILEDREAYSLQGENIITWEERLSSTSSVDLALSFQENEGCLQVWNQIQEIQGNYAVGNGGEAGVFRDRDDDMIGPSYEGSRYELKDFPECRISNLEVIRDQLMCPPMHRENVAGMLIDADQSYLKKLVSLFSDLEDLEDLENLKIISQVMRCIIALNDNRVLESILLDLSIYEGVLGGIEYDPELQSRGNWRKFFNKDANFNEVISMDNHTDLRNSIHVAFRAALLRDAATRPGQEDGALSGVIQYLYFTHSEIISNLVKERNYLRQIIMLCVGQGNESVPQSAPGGVKRTITESRGLALRFLQEMCSISKSGNIPMSTRDELFNCLMQELPLFDALTNSLGDLTLKTRERSAAAEVLAAVVAYDQGTCFRTFVLKGGHPNIPSWAQQSSDSGSTPEPLLEVDNKQANGCKKDHDLGSEDEVVVNLSQCPPVPCKQSMLSVLLHLLAYDDDMGCLMYYNEVLSKCIEVEMMEASERDNFLAVFYDHYIHWLVDPLVRDSHKSKVVVKSSIQVSDVASNPPVTVREVDTSYSKLTSAEKQSRCNIADLLSYCLKAHTYRMRYFALRNGLLGRVSELCKHPEKFLKLAGLRFIRAAVGAKDDFLNRHIAKKDHFAIVFQVFQQNNACDNLISSAVIDIVEFIRTENVSSLIKYTVENFPGIFDNINYVTTFKALQLKYDQNMEHEGLQREGLSLENNTAKEDELRKSKACDDEEAYFDAEDEDDNDRTSIASSTNAGSDGLGVIPPLATQNKPPTPPLLDVSLNGTTSSNSSVGAASMSEVASPPKNRSPRDFQDYEPMPVKPLSPPFKTRPISPPVDGKDSLGMMFDMKNRVAPVSRANNTVRKIEMVIGSSINADSSPGQDGEDSGSKRQKL